MPGTTMFHGVAKLKRRWKTKVAIPNPQARAATMSPPQRLNVHAALATCALALLVGATSAARPASAETAGQADRPVVEILDWGIVERMRIVGTAPSDTLLGRNHLIDPTLDVEIAERTLDIPACPGTRFGIRYRARENSAGRITEVTVRITHPEQVAPDGRRATTSHWTGRAGLRPSYTGWRFDAPFEMVPGSWTMSLLVGGQVVAEKTFTVRPDPCALTS